MADETSCGPERKTVLITGGSSGIGLEACKIMCSEGHRVITAIRTHQEGERCIREVESQCAGADIHYMICDVSQPASVREFVSQFSRKWLGEGSHLDVLVNNAGMMPPPDKRTAPETNPDWEIAMTTNCLGPILLTDMLKDELKKTARDKGEARLVFVGSAIVTYRSILKPALNTDDIMSRRTPFPGNAVYYKKSKMALMYCVEALKDELKDHNIKVVVVCPGFVPNTSIHKNNSAVTNCVTKCCLGCCCYLCVRPVTNNQGGGFIVDMATRERGSESHGLFYSRGNQVNIPPECQSQEERDKVIGQIRRLAEG